VAISDMTVLLYGSSQTHLGTSMPSGGGHIIRAHGRFLPIRVTGPRRQDRENRRVSGADCEAECGLSDFQPTIFYIFHLFVRFVWRTERDCGRTFSGLDGSLLGFLAKEFKGLFILTGEAAHPYRGQHVEICPIIRRFFG